MDIILNRIRPFLLTVRRALSFVWQSSPSLAIGSIVVRVIQGLLPLAVLYLTKLLIDAVTEGLKTPSDESSLTQITTILAGLAGVAVASAMLTVVSSLISKIQAREPEPLQVGLADADPRDFTTVRKLYFLPFAKVAKGVLSLTHRRG